MHQNLLKNVLLFRLMAATILLFSVASVGWATIRPWWFTQLHQEEMAASIQHFRQVEMALETRRQPDAILSVATQHYLPTFIELNQVGQCERCDRFWVVASAEVHEIRVLEYTATTSRVWARVITWGHMVNSTTYERLKLYEAPLKDEAVYLFVRDSVDGLWKLNAVQN